MDILNGVSSFELIIHLTPLVSVTQWLSIWQQPTVFKISFPLCCTSFWNTVNTGPKRSLEQTATYTGPPTILGVCEGGESKLLCLGLPHPPQSAVTLAPQVQRLALSSFILQLIVLPYKFEINCEISYKVLMRFLKHCHCVYNLVGENGHLYDTAFYK